MSYQRYGYSSPYGSHNYQHSSYTSPSGNNSYSSTTRSSSSRYNTLGGSLGGSMSNLSSSLITPSRQSTYSSSPYSSSLYSSRSAYDSSSRPYSSNRYSGDYSSYTPSSSLYTPSSSSYNRSKYLSDSTSSYTPRSRPTYDVDTSSKRSTTDIGTSSSRKSRYSDDDDISDYKPRKKATEKTEDVSITKTTDTSETRRRRREKADEEEGSASTRSAAADVSSVTKQTESLNLESNRGYEPPRHQPVNESARFQEQTHDTPQFRGYTNPNIQSNSFKTLQNVIDSGQDPGSYFQKAPWQSQTANQVTSEPRKYTPSQTWSAVHSDNNRNGHPPAGSYAPPQAAPYRPPPQPVRAPAPAPSTNMRNFGQQMHAPHKYNYMFDSSSPKPAASPIRTTEIPHGDGVATKGTSAMNQQSANSDKIPVCAKCETDIRGPFVLALNKSWCPHHFTCSKCESELVNMGFVELNGNIYCENDYEAFYAPKCAKCRKAIVGDTVNALEKTWHPACFVCNECGNPISSGAFHVEEGMPYCMNDWSRLFQTKCTGCSFAVEPGDKWIEALDANWHSECFVCGKCKVKLEGQPFYPRDGKPFCKEHAQG